MDVMDIISTAVRHMVEGLMFHDQMMQYFSYIGMPGLARLQEKRYRAESKGMTALQKYAIQAYGKIPSDSGTNARDYLPGDWRDTPREQTATHGPDSATVAIQAWEGWEEDTEKLYGQCYFSAGEIRNAALSERMAALVRDADREHRFASELLARVRATDADPGALALLDASICKEYKDFMRRCTQHGSQ